VQRLPPFCSRIPSKTSADPPRSVPCHGKASIPPTFYLSLMQPWNCFARPHTGRVGGSKLIGNFAQHRVIVRCFIVRDSPPVHCFRCKVSITKACYQIAVPSLRIAISYAQRQCDRDRSLEQRPSRCWADNPPVAHALCYQCRGGAQWVSRPHQSGGTMPDVP
jgi:hypothetical protein